MTNLLMVGFELRTSGFANDHPTNFATTLPCNSYAWIDCSIWVISLNRGSVLSKRRSSARIRTSTHRGRPSRPWIAAPLKRFVFRSVLFKREQNFRNSRFSGEKVPRNWLYRFCGSSKISAKFPAVLVKIKKVPFLPILGKILLFLGKKSHFGTIILPYMSWHQLFAKPKIMFRSRLITWHVFL